MLSCSSTTLPCERGDDTQCLLTHATPETNRRAVEKLERVLFPTRRTVYSKPYAKLFAACRSEL
jgi:hypothetical protein